MKSAVFKIRDYRVIFTGRILSATALQAQAVIVGWHVYELTKDPLWLGLIGLTEAVPAIIFAFLSGHVVDNKRAAAIYRLSVFTMVLNSTWLWFSAWPGAPISDSARLVSLFSAVFISGMARSFTSPALFTLFSHIVPKRLQSEASAWNSSAFQTAAIVGPALGGLLYGVIGPTLTFAVPPVLLFGCFLTTNLLSPETLAMRSPTRGEPFVESVKAGIAFVWKQKILLSSMTLDMFSVLFGGAVAVLPMFSDEVLHAGSTGLGILRAAPSVGSGLVALYLAFQPLQVISGKMLLWMVAGFGVSTLLFGVSNSYVTALVCLAATGIFDGVSMVIRNTLLQLITPDHMRGRVSALSLIFITSSNEIGAFESGVAARLLTLIPSILLGGAMTLVVVGTTAALAPELRATRIRPADENAR
jgi:MFS family permease